MAPDFNLLDEKAYEIKNESRVRMNTAVRIGTMFQYIIAKMKEFRTEGGASFGTGTGIGDIGIANDNAVEFDGITTPGIYRYIYQGMAETGYLTVSKSGGALTQRLLKAGGMVFRRNGADLGSGNFQWDAWYPESEQDYSTATDVTPRRWIDGSPTCERTFVIPCIANGETYTQLSVDVNTTVFEISGTTDLAIPGGLTRRAVTYPGIDVSFTFNKDLVIVNNTGFQMRDTVIIIKTCPLLSSGQYGTQI